MSIFMHNKCDTKIRIGKFFLWLIDYWNATNQLLHYMLVQMNKSEGPIDHTQQQWILSILPIRHYWRSLCLFLVVRSFGKAR
jgi:hypothetical protein